MFKEEIIYPTQEFGDKKHCEKVVAKSIERVEKEGIEIGFGKTAKILVSDLDSQICMKAVGNKKISSNDVEKEMNFMDKLSLKGRRVPKPVCAVVTDKKDYLFMETIKGNLSIENILSDETGKALERLPENFDFKKFFTLLRREVELMHEEDKTYHRDLHAGNVMIDENGEPVIIDFGDAVELYISTEDPYRSMNAKGEVIRYPKTDEQYVNEMYKALGEYLNKFNWFNK